MTQTFKLTDRQKMANAMLAGPQTHCCLKGGSRSGKTFKLVRALVLRALKAPNSRHAIFRFRFNHLIGSIFHDTFPKVMELCFPGQEWTPNKSDWFIKFSNGSELWFGGLDDSDRTEKVLGQEYATIFFNECSQIPWGSVLMGLTRLAQTVTYEGPTGETKTLKPKAYYDYNPPSSSHWSYKLFEQHRDPDSGSPIPNPENYCSMNMNPEDNKENLSPEYLKLLENMPARMRRRFLHGEYSDSTDGALFQSEIMDKWRVMDGQLPDMHRIVVAVDPSGADDTDNFENDAIGICVAGLGVDGFGYFLEDLTVKAGPATWGKVATDAYDRHQADRVVGEQNYGGAMVKHTIQTARPGTPYLSVNATRGKVVRAEPISSLVEMGKIRMVGFYPALEDELCGMTTAGYIGEKSPNRADAFVWAFTELFPGLTRKEKKTKKRRHARPAHNGSAGWMAA